MMNNEDAKKIAIAKAYEQDIGDLKETLGLTSIQQRHEEELFLHIRKFLVFVDNNLNHLHLHHR